MANNVRQIYLATGNAHKVLEFQQLARTSAVDVEFIRPTTMPVVAEDTGTFVGNARKKAAALKAILPPDAWVLADDSGLCVDALNGAPGVESAYFAGPDGDVAANLAKLVRVMWHVPEGKRSAEFICTLALLYGVNSAAELFNGHCRGILRREPCCSSGFGYDPLFIPIGYSETFAELDYDMKNVISHRARAFARLDSWLKEIIYGSVG